MPIQYAQTPRDQFRDLIPTFRNADLIALLQPLVLLHQQIHSNGDLSDRSGTTTQFRNLLLKHIDHVDRIRSRITYNPENAQLDAITIPEVDEALTTELKAAREHDKLGEGSHPSGGDTNVVTTTQLIDVPWMFDGTDQSGTIRLTSQLEPRFKSGPGYLMFGVVNETIIACTTLESRFNSRFLSLQDSLRVQGHLQRMVTLAMQFMGEARRLDVPESVLPSERPSGPGSSPNTLGESSGNVPASA